MQVDSSSTSEPVTNKHQLRLWPAVLFCVLLGIARVWATVGEPAPFKFFFGLVIAPAVATILLHLWWLFFSRLRWADRLLGFGVFVAAAVVTVIVAGKNFPAMGLILYALPVVAVVWVAWLLISIPLPWSIRRAGVVLVFLGSGLISSLLRVDGMDGSFKATFNWRWTPTPEDKLLSDLKSGSKHPASADSPSVVELTLQEGDWPCFRGRQRDSRLTGVRIRTDWDKSPPKEVWRHRVGPGWSSCTVVGNRLFTQEQRGDDEFVACYDTETGSEVWTHHDATRFEEVVAGAGPRGTPTFHEGRIFALGANGQLNCLNAATGKPYWSKNIGETASAKPPQWGFSSSPLVSHGLVSVFAGGADGKSVVAYSVESGELAWMSGDGTEAGKGLHGYCSTQDATIDGVEQVLITTNVGLTSFQPEKGTVLWEHRWPVEQARIVQPAVLNGNDILLGTGMSGGTRRLSIQRESDDWQVKEQWTTKSIKPYYNDLVVNDDYLYGFDGPIFMCVSLADGRMKWRARGYGNGQVLLLVDQALLLILTEKGDVALVRATPDQHQELALFKAIEGKTWNHPTVAHGKLFVRNAEEIACFTLPMEEESTPTVGQSE
jgi:outer membrane protein assembly factor BamB